MSRLLAIWTRAFGTETNFRALRKAMLSARPAPLKRPTAVRRQAEAKTIGFDLGRR